MNIHTHAYIDEFVSTYIHGDQIGRIFAHWAIIYFGQWFEKLQKENIFWAAFSHGTSYVFILSKKRVGLHFGDFFKNSSGHPATYSLCQ
jgi:hypothetical protein